ncbi:MAG: hypothetical protein KKH92_01935 [Firmicutes bacterium]|nr:hypothetical protein [Bacillota bacterium]
MAFNIFNTICFILFFSAMIKVFFGVFFHDQLYDFARRQYSSNKMSVSVKLLMIYAFSLAIFVWIGTIFFYQPYAWILTAILSIASIKSLSLFFRWNETSRKFVSFINEKYNKLWIVDVIVAILGVSFLIMGFTIYK